MRLNSAKKIIDIYIIIFDDFNLLDVAGPTQAFTQANDIPSNATVEYKISTVSIDGGLIRSNSGLSLNSSKLSEVRIEQSTLLISGGNGVNKTLKDDELIDWIREFSLLKDKRIGSICTGAFILAESGLLNGRKAVTHWDSVQRLQADYPEVIVEVNPIYIQDRGIWTSAGVSCGIDLALALISDDLGRISSLETARELVVYLKRSGGQSQFSTLLMNQINDKSEVFYKLHNWIENNLDLDLSIERLADKMNMSVRTFYRIYKEENGVTPAKNVERIRIAAAKRMLENSTSNLNVLGKFCGFGSERHFRNVFINQVGIDPKEYQQRFKL